MKLRHYGVTNTTEEVVDEPFTFTNPVLNFISYPIIKIWSFWMYPTDLILDIVFKIFIIPLFNLLLFIKNCLCDLVVRIYFEEASVYEIIAMTMIFVVMNVSFVFLKNYFEIRDYEYGKPQILKNIEERLREEIIKSKERRRINCENGQVVIY